MEYVLFPSWIILGVVVMVTSCCDCSALGGSGGDESSHFEVDGGVNLVGKGSGPIGDGLELPAGVLAGLPSLAGLLSFGLI